MSPLLLPEYLDYGQAARVYRDLSERALDEEIEISFERCKWADHSELHKLAVALADRLQYTPRLVIRAPRTSESKPAERRAEDRHERTSFGSVDVFRYARRMGVLSFLFKQARDKVVVVSGEDVFTSEEDLDPLLGDGRPQREGTLAVYHPYIPMQAVSDQVSVERTSDLFSTGEHIEELLNHYTELDYVRSGEFAILIVNELIQNIVEHAWESGNGHPGPAAISLSVVKLGKREDPSSRHAVRLRYAPDYERMWINVLNAPGYLDLCVADTGVGIPTSLAASRDECAAWFPGLGRSPSAQELLAAAFWADVTRDAGPHRPGHRGLFFVFEFIREYQGALFCQSGPVELAVAACGEAWQENYLKREPLNPTLPSDTRPSKQVCKGTYFRLLLPLVARRRRQRSFWQIAPTSPLSPLSQIEPQVPIDVPMVVAAPSAPSSQAFEKDRRLAMQGFRDACAEVVYGASSFGQEQEATVLWVTASRTREWRKQHIQMLLDEISKASCLLYALVVNLPSSQFRTFLFLARHSLPIENGRAIFLLDEAGRLGLVYRDHKPAYDRFMQWARERGRLPTELAPEDQLLAGLAWKIETTFDPLTLHDVLFSAMRAGINREFANVLEDYRDTERTVTIRAGTAVRGYIELDEALRDTSYVRALGSCIQVALKYAIKPAGIIVVRRAAERLMQSYDQLDRRRVWTMTMPAPDLLPSAEWLESRESLCILTDVVTTGRELADLVTQLRERTAGSLAQPRLVVLCPLLTDIRSGDETRRFSLISDSTLPGIASLEVPKVGRIPVVWVQRTTVELTEPQANSDLVPDPATNIIFDDAHRLKGREGVSDVGVAEFCRLAESKRAIWLGHVSITGDHFDLEFDMRKLLEPESAILRRFATHVANVITERNIDTILYPDESRIHMAIPAVEDLLLDGEGQLPKAIRLRRAKDGTLFWRAKDSEDFSRSRHTVLLDDAINSGGTVRQMLESAAALGQSLRSMLLYVLVSRQTQSHEDLLRVMSAVKDVPFAYRCFIHFPVTFFSEADCPFCLRQRLATALAVAPGPGSAVARAMEELAESLRPAFMYGLPRSSTRPQEPTSRYTVPLLKEGSFVSERFDTLSGAKACLAASIAKQRDLDVRTAVSLLQQCNGNFLLWAYALYTIASRNATRGAFWQDDVFRQGFTDVCQRVGRRLPVTLPLDTADPIADGALDLVVAAWFAPDDALPWALATLVGKADSMLSYEFLRNELFLLSFRLATLKLTTGNGQSQAVERLRSAVGAAQKRISQHHGPKRVVPLEAIERLIRLRQVLQIAEGEPLKEPWLAGLVYLLTRLSYKGGHEFIGYVNKRDLAEGLRLYNSVSGLLNKVTTLQGQLPPSDPDQVFSEITRFLGSSRTDLTYLANALTPVLSNWLRALEFPANYLIVSAPSSP